MEAVKPITICIACLQVDDVDKDGFCLGCSPDDDAYRETLIALLKGEQQE
jgi:predicted Fe-S protein YdhL (DUF1289 family)